MRRKSLFRFVAGVFVLSFAPACASSFDVSALHTGDLSTTHVRTVDGQSVEVPAEWSAEVELVQDRGYRLMVPSSPAGEVTALRVRSEHRTLAEDDGLEDLDVEIDSERPPRVVGSHLALRDGERTIYVPMEDVRRVHVDGDRDPATWVPFVVLGGAACAALLSFVAVSLSSIKEIR
jgi:hypothetical protein